MSHAARLEAEYRRHGEYAAGKEELIME